jgi:putative transposase
VREAGGDDRGAKKNARRVTTAEATSLWPSASGALTRTEFCSLVAVSRTTLWRRLRREEDGNTVQHPLPKSNLEAWSPWEDVVREWCESFVTYGYRRLHAMLKRCHLDVGKHRLRRFLKEAGLAQQGPAPDTGRTPGPPPPEPTGPNRAWQIDATKVRTEYDGWVWQTTVLDVFDRRVVNHVVRKTCRSEDAMDALARALESAFGARRPEGLAVIHDRGSQFTAWSFRQMLLDLGIKDVVTAVRHPQSCGRLERWHRTLKEECIWLQQWDSLDHLDDAVWRYVRHYNYERVHSALGYCTPMEIHYQFVPDGPVGRNKSSLLLA